MKQYHTDQYFNEFEPVEVNPIAYSEVKARKKEHQQFKSYVVSLLQRHSNSMTFQQLQNALGDKYKGDTRIKNEMYENILYWRGFTVDAHNWLLEMLNEGVIELKTVSHKKYKRCHMYEYPITTKLHDAAIEKWMPCIIKLKVN